MCIVVNMWRHTHGNTKDEIQNQQRTNGKYQRRRESSTNKVTKRKIKEKRDPHSPKMTLNSLKFSVCDSSAMNLPIDKQSWVRGPCMDCPQSLVQCLYFNLCLFYCLFHWKSGTLPVYRKHRSMSKQNRTAYLSSLRSFFSFVTIATTEHTPWSFEEVQTLPWNSCWSNW